MTNHIIRLIAILSRLEQGWQALDWAEIRRILKDGLCAFIAGCILAALYTVKGVKSTYQWLHPRLANLLQHPGQTLRWGPETLYYDCFASVMLGRANWAERYVVRIGAFVILTVHIVSDTIATIKQWQDSLTVATVSTWAKDTIGII